jgi:hypothetical protein
MPNTYELIQSTVLGSDQSGIDFSSITNTYDDLVMYTSIRSTKAVLGTTAIIRFNNDSNANYDYKQIYAFGTGVGGYTNTNASMMFSQCPGSTNTSGIYNAGWYYIPQYRQGYWKNMGGECVYPNPSGTNWQSDVWGFTWKSTSAITSINFSMDGGNMAAGSVVSLYGIKYT